ncbi:MAG TPA: cytochrome c biogenesis protein CcdA [Gemmatimonadaceae bacterium]|nr:cytochrome c biogenesis protein CcdA [Gemmatimonadaceae bacterium]
MLILAFVGGILTILSPCILPVIPLVFAARGRAFLRETIPMLIGLAAAFAASAAIGAGAAHWLASAAAVGRIVAIVVVGLVGAALLLPRLAQRLVQPVVSFGASLSSRATPGGDARGSVAARVMLGAAIGMLWAPCAGPILALLVAGTARSPWRESVQALFAFALGGAVSLGAALWLGKRAGARMRWVHVYEETIRRATGGAALACSVLVATGWDRSVFRLADFVSTAHAETLVLQRFSPAQRPMTVEPDVAAIFAPAKAAPTRAIRGLRTEARPMPGFAGATTWINSGPLTLDSLRGKVVLIDFWTFQCYNCLNALPHVKALYEKYHKEGLVVIGVHTPELPQERVVDNVRREVKRLGIAYPVVVDNDYAIWNAYHNQYWPAAYYADASGELRFSHFGEGAYDEQDQAVARLLGEARQRSR